MDLDRRRLLVVLLVAAVGYLVDAPVGVRQAQACGQNELPFNGLDFRLSPGGVAVDSAGDVYVTSEGMYGRVVELAPGSSTPTVLPFTGLYQPQGVAVDSGGRRIRHRLQQPGGEVAGRVEQPDRCCRSPASITPKA